MNIGVDIDDTITSLYRTKVRTAKKYIADNKMPYKLVDKTKNYLSEMFNWPREVCNKFWEERGSVMLAKAHPRRFVKDVISRLRKEGHKIIIITARSTDVSDDAYTFSKTWLDKHFIEYDKILVHQLSKLQACIDEKIDVFIDDLPKHVNLVSENGISAVLMNTIANKTTKVECERVSNWKQFYKIINNKAKALKEE